MSYSRGDLLRGLPPFSVADTPSTVSSGGDGGGGRGRDNPSGLAALALDGRTISSDAGVAHVEAVVFPVRFADPVRKADLPPPLDQC